MPIHRAVTASLLLLLVAACSRLAPQPAPPGYGGPIASVEARNLLAELAGATFEDTTGALGGGTITVGPFGVVPNPLTGKGPVVVLEGPAGTRYLPMLADGDVADLWHHVHGAPPVGVSGAQSDAYRAVWESTPPE